MRPTRSVQKDVRQAKAFDVICAGEALWKVADQAAWKGGPRLTASGGPVAVALTLAREGLRVGVAAVIADDAFGRGYVERVATKGIDTGGIAFARPRKGLVLIDAGGGASPLASDVEEAPPLEVPAGWSAQVLVLTGLSPVVSHAAALCKEARGARRAGTFVLLDFNASLHVWAGRDPRTILMVLREVDAARCSLADLAVLGMDVASARASLRRDAVLVVTDAAGGAVATGPFGEVSVEPLTGFPLSPWTTGAGDLYTAALCAALTRSGEPGESPSARWNRALHRGREAASADA